MEKRHGISEIWVPIPNYEDSYEISSIGNVRSLSRIVKHPIYGNKQIKGKILKPRLIKGYHHAGLYKNGKMSSVPIHRIICSIFIKNSDNKKEVNHKNGIKTDNRLENLEWVTSLENRLHAIKSGLIPNGSSSARSKLTEEDAINIKYSQKHLSSRSLAKIYNVAHSTISGIRRCVS